MNGIKKQARGKKGATGRTNELRRLMADLGAAMDTVDELTNGAGAKYLNRTILNDLFFVLDPLTDAFREISKSYARAVR